MPTSCSSLFFFFFFLLCILICFSITGKHMAWNVCCPYALVVQRQGKVVGCKSACLAERTDRYCCTGEFANPKICKPTVFARLFKAICPRAYSFAYDDASGLKTCKAPPYVMTFSPPN